MSSILSSSYLVFCFVWQTVTDDAVDVWANRVSKDFAKKVGKDATVKQKARFGVRDRALLLNKVPLNRKPCAEVGST